MNSEIKNENHYLTLSRSFSSELNQLKSNLIEAAEGKQVKLMMVTSSKSGEGKTLSAINIAKTLAGSKGVRVLIIDANFRSPKLHEIFDTPQQPGLADIVLEQSSFKDCCHPTKIDNLDVLSNGTPQNNNSWLCDSESFENTLNSLSTEYDYIVVDTNSFLGSSEMSLICHLFDAVLLVIECEMTKWQIADTTAEKIKKAGGNLLGTIMNRRKLYIPRFFYG